LLAGISASSTVSERYDTIGMTTRTASHPVYTNTFLNTVLDPWGLSSALRMARGPCGLDLDLKGMVDWGDDGGGRWLVRMEWCPTGWSVCLPLLIFPCTMKSRSSLLALAHLGGPRKRAIKRLWWLTLTSDVWPWP